MKMQHTCFAIVACAAAMTVSAKAQTSGVITGCLSRSNSVLHVVSSAAECDSKTESVVTWLQNGPQGPQGVPGLPGAQGAAGAKGATGAQGPIGKMGVLGPAGLQGATGPIGPTGAAGAAGVQGFPGPTGPIGPAGPTGSALVPVVTWFTDTIVLPPSASVTSDLYLTCPGNGILVDVGCGSRDYDDRSIYTIDLYYLGVDENPGNAFEGTAVQTMRCRVGNKDYIAPSKSHTVAYSAACLTTVPASTKSSAANSSSGANAKVYSMCSYDPDTQHPCTRADAVVTAPSERRMAEPTPAAIAKAQAQAIADEVAETAASATGKPAITPTHKKVTLWFEN